MVIPIPIAKKTYANSSGSLIGVRKRTIDNAPTKPRERANDDLTTDMIIVVQMLNNGKTFASLSGLEKVFDCDLYIFESKKESIKDIIIEKVNEVKETLADDKLLRLFKTELLNLIIN